MPEAGEGIYWTKVSFDTFVSAGYAKRVQTLVLINEPGHFQFSAAAPIRLDS